MITDLKNRPLKWVFKYVYQPANPKNLNEREMKVVSTAVDEFCVFAGGNPAVSKIRDEDLAAFRLYLKAKGFSLDFCYRRRVRVQWVVHHVLPPPPDISQKAPADGSLRQYAGDRARMKIIAGDDADLDRYAKDVGIAIRKLCRFVGRDVKVAEVTAELISDLEESMGGTPDARKTAWLLRRVMRTVDPMTFRRRGREGSPPQSRPRPGNDSSYYLDNFFDQEFEPRRLRSARPNTKRLYRHTLRQFAQVLERPPVIDDLNEGTLNRFALHRRDHGVAPKSINRHLANLLAIWRWCCDENLLEKRPNIQLERVPRQVPVAWTEPEMKLLARTVRKLTGRVGNFRARDWWAALVHVLFCTGERIGAVTSLNWSHVDLRSGWVIFRADDRKGGSEDNPVRISRECVTALRRIHVDAGPVFPWPHHPTYLWKVYGEILHKAGLPNDRWRKFHCIRKTVGSHIEAAGGNATNALRHSDRRVTEKYLDPRITKPQQPVDLLFRLTEGGAR